MDYKERERHRIDWPTITQQLGTLAHVEGGFSPVQRGIIALPGGEHLFVKIGVDTNTKKWAKKEVDAYKVLRSNNYPHAPSLVVHNEDRTAFALEALTPEQGWDWSNKWSEQRLAATLEAMDELAALELSETEKALFAEETLGPANDGWWSLAESEALQQSLLTKLHAAGHDDIARLINFDDLRIQSAYFKFGHDLVHNDVRADNCAWNAQRQVVQLVDWNWLQFGDRRIDINAMLVHVHRSGFDVTKSIAKSRLSTEALMWMAGFWLKASATPIWPGGPAHLRDSQMESGITAINLAATLEN